jgi:hypothetical protein
MRQVIKCEAGCVALCFTDTSSSHANTILHSPSLSLLEAQELPSREAACDPLTTHPPTLLSHAQAHMRKPSRLLSAALIDFRLQSNNGAIRLRSACDNIYLGKIDLGDMCISLNLATLADREHTRRPKFAVSHLHVMRHMK